ncbi:hypothetical protein BKA62DRAFT_714108, partial [Auriculariales sp. MPI-PUGE-AT-0066]
LAICDQPSEHSCCRLPLLHDSDTSTTQSMFDAGSLHLVATQTYVHFHDYVTVSVTVWNLTDLEAPLMARSIDIRSTTTFLEIDGRFRSYYWNIKRQAAVSLATLEVSPLLILALEGEDEDHSVTTQGTSQVIRVYHTNLHGTNVPWLSVKVRTTQTLQAPPLKVEEDAWEVTVPETPSPRLCWLPEVYRALNFDNSSFSGAHFLMRAPSGAVTIFDCSGHPIFQLPGPHDQETTHTS